MAFFVFVFQKLSWTWVRTRAVVALLPVAQPMAPPSSNMSQKFTTAGPRQQIQTSLPSQGSKPPLLFKVMYLCGPNIWVFAPFLYLVANVVPYFLIDMYLQDQWRPFQFEVTGPSLVGPCLQSVSHLPETWVFEVTTWLAGVNTTGSWASQGDQHPQNSTGKWWSLQDWLQVNLII